MQGEIGTLRPGAAADVACWHDQRGRWTLRDNEGNTVRAERLLRPHFCLRAGRAPRRRRLDPARRCAEAA